MPAQKRFLAEVRQGMVPQTLWKYEDVGHTQEAKKELLEFVDYQDTDNVLDTVKPTRMLQRILQLGTKSNDGDMVLDFFAGSCSMAHAVLAQNRADGGNRKFVAVQLPEPLPKPEKELKRLTDIGKSRLRCVIAKLHKADEGTLEMSDPDTPEDLGFKVFKLTPPTIQPFDVGDERDPELYAAKLTLYNDPLTPGWKPEHVLWEVALREGYGLQTRFEPKKLGNGNTLYEVTDPEAGQTMAVCLDDAIKVDLSRHYELTPERVFVCRDMALDDTAAANLALQCRLKTI
jgi:adenine-specific DNA-methyltransferase